MKTTSIPSSQNGWQIIHPRPRFNLDIDHQPLRSHLSHHGPGAKSIAGGPGSGTVSSVSNRWKRAEPYNLTSLLRCLHLGRLNTISAQVERREDEFGIQIGNTDNTGHLTAAAAEQSSIRS